MQTYNVDDVVAKSKAVLEEKLKQRLAEMGNKYLMHPDNFIKKKKLRARKLKNKASMK